MGHLSKLLRDNCADLSRVPVELFVKAVLLDCGLSPRIAMTPEKLCVVLREATPEVTSLVEGPHEIMDRLAEEIRSKLPPTAEHPSDASPPEVNTSEPDRTVITTGGGASVTVPTRCPECECYQVRATFISGELRSVRCARPECDWRTLHGKAAKGGVG